MSTLSNIQAQRICKIAGIAAQAAALCLAAASVAVTCARIMHTAKALQKALS